MIEKVYNCLHPLRVFNRNTHCFEWVPCRKCDACLNRYAASWSDRCRRECEQHRYSYFFTLCYNNDFLPYVTLKFDDASEPIQLRPSERLNSLSKKFLPLYPFMDDCNALSFHERCDYDFPIAVRHKDNAIGVLCREEIQNFMKRLRKNINEYYQKRFHKNDFKGIRYFVCGEYGPRTYRPHYHGILWFDDEWLIKEILRFIKLSWAVRIRVKGQGRNRFKYIPFCSPARLTERGKKPTCGLIKGKGYKYVSQYISGNTELPTVLLLERFKPFHLSSKNPAVGYYKDGEKEMYDHVKKFFDKRNLSFGASDVTEHFGQQTTKDGVCVTRFPFPKDIQNSLWSKCFEYSRLSDFTKFHLYSFVFRHWEYFDGKRASKLDGTSGFHMLEYMYPVEYAWLRMDKPQNQVASLKCARFCRKYGVDPYDYVSVLIFYYRQVERLKLENFYKTQDAVIRRTGNVRSALWFYPEAFNLPSWTYDEKEIYKETKRPGDLFNPPLYYRFNPHADIHFFETLGIPFSHLYKKSGLLNTDNLLKLRYEKSSHFLQYSTEERTKAFWHNKNKKINNGLPDDVT